VATRFYFPETEAAAVSPAIQGTYAHTNTLRRRLLQTADASALTSTAYTPDGADHGVAGAAHVRQYVSDQISARTVDGTWKLQVQAFEPNANCNQSINVLIFVCSSDGSTIKETLFAQAVAGNELGTALRNLTASGAISTADLEDNDRIVIQIGTSGTPGGGGGVQGHNSTFRWGCDASSGDLAEDETETGTTFRGWVEFSTNLFTTPYSADLTAATITVTPQAVTRLNDYLAQITAPAFAVTAQSLTRLNDWLVELTAPVVNFTAQDLTWDMATGFAAELTAAAFNYTAQAVARFNDYVAQVTAASIGFTGQAANWLQDTIMSLSAAAFNFVAQAARWSLGGEYASPFYPRLTKACKRAWKRMNGPSAPWS
jgi:hypothetical protein